MHLLKQALKEGDWEKVADAYEVLTGDRINPPEPVVTTLESRVPSIDTLIEDLLSMKDNELIDEHFGKAEKQTKPTKKRGRPKGSKNRKAKVDSKLNPLSDDADDDDDLRDLSVNETKAGKRKIQFITSDKITEQDKADKKLYNNMDRTARRKPFRGVNIDCASCSKAFVNVNPVHIKVDADTKKGKFICNECQSRGKV